MPRHKGRNPAEGIGGRNDIGIDEHQQRVTGQSGKLMAGMPQSVHNVQNTGSPVEERPFGAAPVAAGVRIAS